jgi:hypothetical protein
MGGASHCHGKLLEMATTLDLEKSVSPDGCLMFSGSAKVLGSRYFLSVRVKYRADGTPYIGLTDAAWETFTGKPVRGKASVALEDLMDQAKAAALLAASSKIVGPPDHLEIGKNPE